MKKLIAILLALLMILSMAACASSDDGAATNDDSSDKTNDASTDDSSEDSSGENYRIAFIQKAMSDQYFIDCDKGSAARAAELGVTVDFFAPDGGQTDIEGQVNLMNDCIIKAYDIIMIDVSDDFALIPSIVSANEADIPVVLFNDTVDEAELEAQGGFYETYIGLDSFEAAKMVGEYCGKTSEPGKVLVLEGVPGLVASEDRSKGFVEGLPEGFELVASQPANWDMNEAYDVVTNMFTSNPDITVIFAANSNMGLGAIQALKDMGIKDKVDVYDFDCTNEDLQAIVDGDLLATLRYPTIEWASLGVDTCVAILNGEEVEKEIYTAVEVVDATTAPDLMA